MDSDEATRLTAQDLVRSAQRGDTLAMNDLLDLLTPYVLRICGSIALDSGPDAAQDTMITVLRRIGTLREPEALFGWVRVIAVRESVRHARARGRERLTDDLALSRVPAPGDPELAADVRGVLARLSPEHRAVLLLRDLEGLDETSAAALLDIPDGTVKSRLHRARNRFKKAWTS